MNSDSQENDDLQLRAAIDRSLRYPLIFLFTSAAAWLAVATLLGFLSALALNLPQFLGNVTFLHYGRLHPAHFNALVYGWGIQAGLGIAYWIMGRLSRSPLKNPVTLIVAGHLWNAVVTVGVLAILFGWGTSIPWLDFPSGYWPFVLLTYVVLALWMLGMFASRKRREVFVSQWFLLGAIFWFPWIYLTANCFIHAEGGSAVMKAGISAWYGSNLGYMVLGGIALGSAFYMVPKVLGRPLHSESLAHATFWSLAAFVGWTGINRYLGGPFPAWMPSAGSAAAIFLLIPAVAVLVNLVKTGEGKLGWMNYSPSLRFTYFGAAAFLVLVVLGILLSVFPTSKVLQFTYAQSGFDLLAVYGFFTMTAFGAIYFIVPRVCGCEWPSGGMIRFHFWFSAYGIGAIVTFMMFAGMAQGYLIDNWSEDFSRAVERVRPYLAALALGWFFIGIANVAFLLQLALMALRLGRRGTEGPTLIHKKPEDYFAVEMARENAQA